MSRFQSPSESLGTLDAPRAADLISATADIALVLDRDGTITDICATSEVFAGHEVTALIGRPWIETVTVECRDKVADILAATGEDASRQRQINQRLEDGTELLVLYSTITLNAQGERLAVGKDLSSLTQLQQRLVNVQQSMERDYARLRQFETRYRMLFQSSGEAILIAHATTLRVIEANPAACRLLGTTERKLVGSGFMRWFDESVRAPLEGAIGMARLDGKPITLELGEGSLALGVTLSVFKTDSHGHLLVRLRDTDVEAVAEQPLSEQTRRLASLIESAPDGLVVTDIDGAIVAANTEFLDLAQLTGTEAAIGRTLASWLGQGSIDYQIIMASLREHGSIRLYATRLRGEFGSVTDVEVSAVPLRAGEIDCIGFAIRDIGHRVAANDEQPGLTPRSIDQLTQLVGRVPLKELVRESTELIEQLCIQAALKLTNNNRASAAEMLGLSRQSLYVKLRRYALEDEDDPAA